MTAKELMIGDWILIDEPDKYAGCKGTVQTLCNHQTDDGFYLTVYIEGDKGYCNTEVFNKDLRPIPLTKEILEKNGFKKLFSRYVCFLSDGDTFITMDYRKHIICIDFEDVDCHYTFPEPIFIHQLQHTLRLCDIDKEITL